MEKLVKDGKVAVLVSPGFGAGWSTWARTSTEEILFDPEVAQAVLDGDLEKAEKIAEAKYPDFYAGGACQLEVEWLEQGTRFLVEEYDGSESLRFLEDLVFVA